MNYPVWWLLFSRSYKKEFIRESNLLILDFLDSRVQAGSNTSTVALRVVGSDEMESLESDPRMTELERTSSNCKGQTRPLVRESAPH
jgi:hypothetical protein